MTKFMEWLFESNHFLVVVGILHWVFGVIQRAYYDNVVEGLLLMIIGVLLVILSKMELHREQKP